MIWVIVYNKLLIVYKGEMKQLQNRAQRVIPVQHLFNFWIAESIAAFYIRNQYGEEKPCHAHSVCPQRCVEWLLFSVSIPSPFRWSHVHSSSLASFVIVHHLCDFVLNFVLILAFFYIDTRKFLFTSNSEVNSAEFFWGFLRLSLFNRTWVNRYRLNFFASCAGRFSAFHYSRNRLNSNIASIYIYNYSSKSPLQNLEQNSPSLNLFNFVKNQMENRYSTFSTSFY